MGRGVSVELHVKGVQEFIGALDTAPEVVTRANRSAMREAVQLVKRVALRYVRRDGRNRLRVYTRTTGGDPVEGRISGNWLGHILEGGARPHEIRAVHATTLAFASGGRSGETGGMIYTKRVHHPGVHDKQFLLPALVNSVVPVQALFEKAADELVRHLAG